MTAEMNALELMLHTVAGVALLTAIAIGLAELFKRMLTRKGRRQ